MAPSTRRSPPRATPTWPTCPPRRTCGPQLDVLEALSRGGPALELAIRSGRVALPLADRGVATVGIERSTAMRMGAPGEWAYRSPSRSSFTREWNGGATPYTWVKTADEILAKAVRRPRADPGARH